ncbi:MAG: 5-formyltetrahydrofolate cyclo-ligase, partial [Nitratireductor sp.]
RRGGTLALPVVVEKAAPLVFRDWRPGMKLEKGVWNIPVPPAAPAVIPDIVISPVVGFDPANYRLGYGGGFFDRTLAALPARPTVIGVGYAAAAIATIYPQPHDIAMDFIVTEAGRAGQ